MHNVTPSTSEVNRSEAPSNKPVRNRPRRWPWAMAGIILVLILAFAFLRVRQHKAPPQASRGRDAGQQSTLIGTTKAQQGDIGVYVNGLGVVTPINTVAVRSRVDGQRVKVFYTEGPILMTTLAAALGALPLVISTGTGSELRRPLGITIVGGLLVSQMLTLYTTPVVYLYLDRARLWWARIRGKQPEFGRGLGAPLPEGGLTQ